jgi:ribosome biogenesis GTPase
LKGVTEDENEREDKPYVSIDDGKENRIPCDRFPSVGGPMSKRSDNSRARRAKRDWTKGNRGRVSRLESKGKKEEDFDDVLSGRESMRPRAITIDDEGDIDDLPKGEVIRAQSGLYEIALEGGEDVLSCRVKRGASTENNDATLVTVGDQVRVQPLEDGHGLIHHIEERASVIGRAGTGSKRGGHQVIAANLELLFCVLSAERDDVRQTVIDRYIVGALLGGVEPVIILNKIDTADEEFQEMLEEGLGIYVDLGYDVIFTSATEDVGIDAIREFVRGKTAALVGQSGVGKSTLVNAVLGREERLTAEVRSRDRRGRHTTTSSEIIPVPGGGRLIDTPGLREFGIWDLEPEELDGYFVEFLDYLQDCKYLPCTHTHEPECAVKKAVEDGKIDPGRYASYLSLYASLES